MAEGNKVTLNGRVHHIIPVDIRAETTKVYDMQATTYDITAISKTYSMRKFVSDELFAEQDYTYYPFKTLEQNW